LLTACSLTTHHSQVPAKTRVRIQLFKNSSGIFTNLLSDIRQAKKTKTYISFQQADDRMQTCYDGKNFIKGKQEEEKRLVRLLTQKVLCNRALLAKSKRKSTSTRNKDKVIPKPDLPTVDTIKNTRTFKEWMSVEDGKEFTFISGRKKAKRVVRVLINMS
jgi:hypothetical protein